MAQSSAFFGDVVEAGFTLQAARGLRHFPLHRYGPVMGQNCGTQSALMDDK